MWGKRGKWIKGHGNDSIGYDKTITDEKPIKRNRGVACDVIGRKIVREETKDVI